jgi:hypothetical protein
MGSDPRAELLVPAIGNGVDAAGVAGNGTVRAKEQRRDKWKATGRIRTDDHSITNRELYP